MSLENISVPDTIIKTVYIKYTHTHKLKTQKSVFLLSRQMPPVIVTRKVTLKTSFGRWGKRLIWLYIISGNCSPVWDTAVAPLITLSVDGQTHAVSADVN